MPEFIAWRSAAWRCGPVAVAISGTGGCARTRCASSLRANLLDRLIHVRAQRREAGEILVHDLLGDAHGHAEATTQSEGLHAVGETVGDGLGLFPLFVRHVGRRDAEDRGRDRAVHVFVGRERRQ